MNLTQKQETFCLKYFELGNASEAARIALYSPKTAAVIGRENLLKPQIQARIQALQQKVEDATIATVLERKQILTQIARGNLIDYQEVGADGGYLNIGKESPNTRAISEITSRTEYSKEGDGTAVVTKVKLHNPTPAIDLLNKMDRIYTDGGVVNVDNRQVNIYVKDRETRDLLSQIGERTQELQVGGADAVQRQIEGQGSSQVTDAEEA